MEIVRIALERSLAEELRRGVVLLGPVRMWLADDDTLHVKEISPSEATSGP